MASDPKAAVSRVLELAVKRGELESEALGWALNRLGEARPAKRVESKTRRPDILAAATRLFATHGYHEATLQDIADQIGLTRPAFYYYFKSKQSILEAICEEAIEEADRVLWAAFRAPARTRVDRLRETLKAYAIHSAEAYSTAIMLRNFDEMSEAAKIALRQRRRSREQVLADLIAECVAAGELNVREPLIAVFTCFEAIHAIHNWHDRKGRLTRAEASEVIVGQLLDGLLPRE